MGSEVLSDDHGHYVLKFSGQNVYQHFRHEIGKHSVQRVPPTERSGRVHTSSISVAVLPIFPEKKIESLKESDLDIKFQCASGPGGQHRNKTMSACRMVHKPTGLEVFITNRRDQHANRKEALRILTAKVNYLNHQKVQSSYDSNRKNMLGDGKRGDKIRTWNFCESRVADHRLNLKTKNIKEMMKGNFSVLFDQKKE